MRRKEEKIQKSRIFWKLPDFLNLICLNYEARALKFAKIDADAIPEIVFYIMRKLVITDFFFKIKINLLEYWNIYMHIAQKSSLLFWFKKLQQVIFLFPGYYEGKKLSYFQCDAKNKYIFSTFDFSNCTFAFRYQVWF